MAEPAWLLGRTLIVIISVLIVVISSSSTTTTTTTASSTSSSSTTTTTTTTSTTTTTATITTIIIIIMYYLPWSAEPAGLLGRARGWRKELQQAIYIRIYIYICIVYVIKLFVDK